MNIESSKDHFSSCKKTIMERRGAGELESGNGVVKVAVGNLPDKGEESTGEVENYLEKPKRCEDNLIDESFEAKEEVRLKNFDPVNTSFHFIDQVFCYILQWCATRGH